MDKGHLCSQVAHKRKSKICRKDKKWKCSKLTISNLFQEVSFDSSSDENDVSCPPEKPEFFTSKFSKILNLKPSKSEIEAFENGLISTKSTDLSISDNESCNLGEYSFKISSEEEDEEENSYLHNSVVDEFKNETVLNKSSEIVSVNVGSLGIEKSATKTKTRVVSCVEKEKNEKTSVSQPKSETFSKTNAQYYYTTDGIVVVLERNETVYIHGLCLLSVLHGEIEILGHIMNKNSAEAKVYSPRGTALLYLKNQTVSDVPATNYLLNLKISIKLTPNCAVVLCKYLHDPNILFIEKHISQQILPRGENNTLPRITFDPKEGNWNLIKTDQNWDKIIDAINSHTKMIICGGKGVGKTTFLRYTLNRLLMKFKKVRVIDLDPGQSEFTVPGSISLVEITEPVFGVNYTHLHKTQRSILSNINIAYEPDKYISSVKLLLREHFEEEIPTVVNYMGYTHGMGLNILSAVIVHVQPTDILQICSRDSKKNYKCLLEEDFVMENAKLFVPDLNIILHYNLHKIESKSDENDGWTAEPRQLREMSVLAFVREMINSDSIYKTYIPLYRIGLNDIKISDLNGNDIPPAAINACLVALCKHEDEKMPIFECLGWGIIRGVDIINNFLVLLTSHKLEILNKVSHLVLGGAVLPPSIHMTPDEVTGLMPYVMEGVLMSFGQITKRCKISVK
ncbi:polynucleotide 5'-hydroxyl-kinase NOL9 [Tribolium madens]|uniref:polynucleotide 5'-hydroxyl-kinase NOL9 n=1 Tax=Tribolium madens TaxID=41895 RepID=UPI001CF75A49|nr:polynucleotide 5'-hydroxyl-kinase NOL9 [Tribolium madens]XP_044259864.1 polynucleotide 5'-hydroxyl-kinase NOL9 [Tribolium madens]